MRILLTTDTVGGVWTFTRELAQGLLLAGHDVALVSFGRAPSQGQRAWAAKTAADFPDRFLYQPSLVPLEWMQDNQQAFIAAARILHRLIQLFKPQLLHASQFCFGKLAHVVPTVITAHSDVLSWAAACRPDALLPSPWLKRYISLVQAGLQQADAVVAPTATMLGALADGFHLPRKTLVISNGRSISSTRRSYQRSRQAVSVGRFWDEAKGLSTLRNLKSPIPILIAGEQHFEASTVGVIPAHLKSLGALSECDLLELFQQSSAYIAPSFYEPFGLAPLEAALCGCAVLVRDIPSFREVWGDAARYFSTPAELDRQLLVLFASPQALRNAQVAATLRAQEFSAARMTSSYLALYEDVLRNMTPQTVRETSSHAA